MHEMSYVVRFVNMALETMEREGGEPSDSRARKVVLEIGELTGLVPEYLEKYFKSAIKGTKLEGAELEIEMRPVQALCSDCGVLYKPVRENGYLCPGCGSSRGKIVDGRHANLKQVILETSDIDNNSKCYTGDKLR